MDKFQVGDKVYDTPLQQWGTVTSLELKRPKWRAEPERKYYFVESTGVVISGYEYGNINAEERFQVGNYFKSEKEAKESKFYEVFHESTSL